MTQTFLGVDFSTILTKSYFARLVVSLLPLIMGILMCINKKYRDWYNNAVKHNSFKIPLIAHGVIWVVASLVIMLAWVVLSTNNVMYADVIMTVFCILLASVPFLLLREKDTKLSAYTATVVAALAAGVAAMTVRINLVVAVLMAVIAGYLVVYSWSMLDTTE